MNSGSGLREFFHMSPGNGDGTILTRLSRHLALAGWDEDCQAALDATRILVIGAGGLGCSVCLSLCGSVFANNNITIVDPDMVEITNLHRQFAYTEEDVGKFKATRLAEICRQRNQYCNVLGINIRFASDPGSLELFESADVVFDCTDNVFVRLLISDTWHNTGRTKTVVSGSCVGWCGQLVTLIPGSPICLRCVYGDLPPVGSGCDRLGQCALQGVMGPVVGIMGNYQVLEFFNILRNKSPKSENEIKLFDFASSNVMRSLLIDPSCHLCSTESNAFPVKNPEVISALENIVEEIDEPTFLSMLSNDDCSVIDVRESTHFRYSHVKGSINLPASKYLHTLTRRDGIERNDLISGIFSHEQEVVVVVCRRGIDSLKFANKLVRTFPKQRFLSLRGGLSGCNLPII